MYKTHQQHLKAHTDSLKEQAVRAELCLFLYKLGVKSAKPHASSLYTLNLLFKQAYGAASINDIILGNGKSTLFGIDPTTYNAWKAGKK